MNHTSVSASYGIILNIPIKSYKSILKLLICILQMSLIYKLKMKYLLYYETSRIILEIKAWIFLAYFLKNSLIINMIFD